MPRTDVSAALFADACAVIPGGVNSPVRAFSSVGGTPRFIKSARGATITDVDGKSYIDYVGSWGPLILGHADPMVVQAVQQAAARREDQPGQGDTGPDAQAPGDDQHLAR